MAVVSRPGLGQSGGMIFVDMWKSVRALPFWVQIWVVVILVPVNFAALLFWDAAYGRLVGFLAAFAVLVNVVPLFRDRGFSKAMALSHVVLWIPLVALIVWLLWQGGVVGGYVWFLWLLLLVDGISLAFDIPDAWKWWQGDRKPAGD